jgi:hypothetical protein
MINADQSEFLEQADFGRGGVSFTDGGNLVAVFPG